MQIMFYNKKQDYNVWVEHVAKIVNSEREWLILLRFEAGNEVELVYSKRKYQLMEIRQ